MLSSYLGLAVASPTYFSKLHIAADVDDGPPHDSKQPNAVTVITVHEQPKDGATAQSVKNAD